MIVKSKHIQPVLTVVLIVSLESVLHLIIMI